MDEIHLQTGETPSILISHVHGDLRRLSGWDRPEFLAEGESDTLQAIFKDGQLTFEAQSDATVYVPRRATVHIRQISGDARIKMLEGTLDVEQVHGDLNLRKIAGAIVGRVSGDLTAQKVEGDLLVESVIGDLSARDVQGRFAVQQASADLYVGGVLGSGEGRALGDVSLHLPLSPGQEVNFSAGADLACRIPADASARVHLSAGGKSTIRLGKLLEHLPPGGSRELMLGGGEARVELKAGGDLLLAEFEPGWDLAGDEVGANLGAEVARRFTTEIDLRMAEINEQINSRIRNSLAGLSASGRHSPEEVGRLTRRAERTAERAREKLERARQGVEREAERLEREAERRAERARHQAEQARMRVEHAGHRAERASGREVVAFHVDAGRKAGGDPVTEEERLTILRMLEQGKITVQQAEQLLAALEGSAG